MLYLFSLAIHIRDGITLFISSIIIISINIFYLLSYTLYLYYPNTEYDYDASVTFDRLLGQYS